MIKVEGKNMARRKGCSNPYAVVELDKRGRLPKDIVATGLLFCTKKEAERNARITNKDPSWSKFRYDVVQLIVPPNIDIMEKKKM